MSRPNGDSFAAVTCGGWEPRKRSRFLWIPSPRSNAALDNVRVCCIAALLSCRHCSGHIRPLVQQTLAPRDAASRQKGSREPGLRWSRCWAGWCCFALLGLVPRCGFWNYGTFNFFPIYSLNISSIRELNCFESVCSQSAPELTARLLSPGLTPDVFYSYAKPRLAFGGPRGRVLLFPLCLFTKCIWGSLGKKQTSVEKYIGRESSV